MLRDLSVETLEKVYSVIKVLVIIFTVLCVIGGIVLCAEGSHSGTDYYGYHYSYNDWAMVAPGIAMIVLIPFVNIIALFFLKVGFAFLYDVKKMRTIMETEKLEKNVKNAISSANISNAPKGDAPAKKDELPDF